MNNMHCIYSMFINRMFNSNLAFFLFLCLDSSYYGINLGSRIIGPLLATLWLHFYRKQNWLGLTFINVACLVYFCMLYMFVSLCMLPFVIL